MNLLSESTLSYLAGHGGSAAVKDARIQDEVLLIRCFRDAFPAGGCWSEEAKAYLAALCDCLSTMDEQLYRHYRAMCDLYRRFVFAFAKTAEREDPVWKDALARGDRMALVDPCELYRQPHKN